MTSQFGQDRFVLDILNGRRNGFFLDSGASDGRRCSNTFLLETQFAWNGICVEPNEYFYSQLLQNRNCTTFNCCIYDRNADVRFVEADTLGGILETYHPSLLDIARTHLRLPVDKTGAPTTVTKKARTIRSILDSANAPPVIDYWSLDTEGSELAILKSFPFDSYSFQVLTVEHNRLPVRREIRAFLEQAGYCWIAELGVDDCYTKMAGALGASWRRR